MCEVRFVECQSCEGAGEIATGTDWIGGVPDARIEPCPDCDGTGRAETPVEPVECDDDLEQRARDYCARNGLDPDDDAADGVAVWQVVAKEIPLPLPLSNAA